jgi:hypothetical protein
MTDQYPGAGTNLCRSLTYQDPRSTARAGAGFGARFGGRR